MKAVIHIGMMKTGSSSIQTWLRSNRVALEAEGVFSNRAADSLHSKIRHRMIKCAVYLTAMHEFGADEETAWMGNEWNIPGMGCAHENSKIVIRQLEKLSRESGHFIYSRESLFTCNEVQMIALDKFLSRFFHDITYVAYIRDTVDFLVSLYSQKLLRGSRKSGTLGYSEFLKKCTSCPVPYGRDSSFENLFEWHKVLGGKLNVRLLESDWLVNGDLIEDFASLVDVDAFENPGRMNQSFAAEYVEYVRILNRKFLRGRIPKSFRDQAIAILKNASSGKPKLAASDAQAGLIGDLHREQENRIRNNFFPGRRTLYSPKVRGDGIIPMPLTDHGKATIECELRENMAPAVWGMALGFPPRII